jgi:hypothetical protein
MRIVVAVFLLCFGLNAGQAATLEIKQGGIQWFAVSGPITGELNLSLTLETVASNFPAPPSSWYYQVVFETQTALSSSNFRDAANSQGETTYLREGSLLISDAVRLVIVYFNTKEDVTLSFRALIEFPDELRFTPVAHTPIPMTILLAGPAFVVLMLRRRRSQCELQPAAQGILTDTET